MGIETDPALNRLGKDRALLQERVDLALKVADLVQQKTGLSLVAALRQYTMLGEIVAPDAGAEKWRKFEQTLANTADARKAIVDFICQEHVKKGEEGPRPFGCFSYTYDAGIVYPHFRNQDSDKISPLSDERVERRMAELRRMFAEIKEKCPDAKTVLGFSWLHNLVQYTRLFPPSYSKSAKVDLDKRNLTAYSIWGQLINADGHVNQKRADAFLHKLAQVDIERFQEAFPVAVLGVAAPVEDFYDFYGIK